MIKLIHISDLHLCDSLKSSVIEPYQMREIQWTTLKNLVEYANSKDIDLILISGDLYERKYFSKTHARRLIKILGEFNGEVLIIFGNHDYVGDKFVFDDIDIPDNIILHTMNKIKRYDFHDLNLSIFMHSWEREVEVAPDFTNVERKNKYNILMAHSGLNIDKAYMPFDKSLVGEAYEYVALGHIHKPMVVDDKFFYPGSLEPLSIKETGPHGGYEIEIDNGVSVSFVDFASLEYVDENIDSCNKSVDEIVDGVKPLASEKIQVLSLTLTGPDMSMDAEELRYALKNYFPYIVINDKRTPNMQVTGINSEFLDDVNDIIESEFEGPYQEDLKRKLISLMNKVAGLWL